MERKRRKKKYLSDLRSELPGEFLVLTPPDPGIIEMVHEGIATLDPVNAEIIRKRFGIGFIEQTLDSIGDELGMTRQAVSKRARKAREQLKLIFAHRFMTD